MSSTPPPGSGGWTPNHQLVKDAIAIFEDNLKEGGFGRSAPRLKQLLQRTDGLCVLAFVFSTPHPQFPEQIRLQMGIKLKNEILNTTAEQENPWKRLPPEYQGFIRRACQQSMHPEQARPIRKISSLVAAAIVTAERPKLDLLMALVRMFQDSAMVEQAFGAVSIVLDDFGKHLPMEAIRPTVQASIALLESGLPDLQRPELQSNILTALNKLIVDNRMNDFLPQYLQLVIRFAGSVPEALQRAEKLQGEWEAQEARGGRGGDAQSGALFGVREGPHSDRLEGLTGLLKSVCQTFVLFMDLQIPALQSILKEVIGFMGQQTGNPSSEVALEACDFWRSFCENGGDPRILETILPQLLPVLLPRLQLGEMDLLLLGEENTEEDPPDRKVQSYRPDLEAEIRPHHVRSAKSSHGGGGGGDGGKNDGQEWQNSFGGGGFETEDEEDEDEDDGDDDYDAMSDYSLRQAAVQALSRIAEAVNPEILWTGMAPIVKSVLPMNPQQKEDPKTQQRLRENWLAVEAVLLGLGASAEGLRKLEQKWMQELSFFIHLTGFLSEVHPRPLVRGTACWTLVRFLPWIQHRIPNPEEKGTALRMFLTWLQKRLLDPNKRVQRIASDTLTRLVERSPPEILERNLTLLLPQIMKTFAVSQMRNRISIFVLLSQLAISLTEQRSFQRLPPQVLEMILRPLLHQIPPAEVLSSPGAAVSHCLALLECLRDIIEASGRQIADFAPQIYHRAAEYLRFGLLKDRSWQQTHPELQKDSDGITGGGGGGEDGSPEEALMGAQLALDLISALSTALTEEDEEEETKDGGQSVERLFQLFQTTPQAPKFSELMEFVTASLNSSSFEVRQTGFALIGDFGILGQRMSPFVETVLRIVFHRLGRKVEEGKMEGKKEIIFLEREAVCVNACWAVQRFAEMDLIPEQIFRPLLELLISILGRRKPSRRLVCNVADAVAQMAVTRSDIVASVMESSKMFAQLWLKAALSTHGSEVCLQALTLLFLRHQPQMHGFLEVAKNTENARPFVEEAMKRANVLRARHG